MSNMLSPMMSPIKTGGPTTMGGPAMDATAALAEDGEVTRLFRKQKKADTSYNFGISLVDKNRALNKWNAQFDHTLDFLMYPSLHV